jgi:hypothetical protein
MRPVHLLALLLAAGCAQAPAQNIQAGPEQGLRPGPVMGDAAAQEALMDRIEREVRMPDGAGAVSSYARYYAWRQGKDGTRNVVAVWQNLTGERPGRHWVTERDFPLIMDGGCGVITLSYDVAAQRIDRVACNGDA